MTWPISNNDGYHKMQKLPITTLYRWYLYDVIGEEANKNISLFNLSPVSEEGNEKELEDSEERLIEISPLLPLIKLYADMNATYTYEVQSKELLKTDGVTPELLAASSKSLKEFYSTMAFNGILSLLSSAVELDLVELHGTFTGLKETDE